MASIVMLIALPLTRTFYHQKASATFRFQSIPLRLICKRATSEAETSIQIWLTAIYFTCVSVRCNSVLDDFSSLPDENPSEKRVASLLTDGEFWEKFWKKIVSTRLISVNFGSLNVRQQPE